MRSICLPTLEVFVGGLALFREQHKITLFFMPAADVFPHHILYSFGELVFLIMK